MRNDLKLFFLPIPLHTLNLQNCDIFCLDQNQVYWSARKVNFIIPFIKALFVDAINQNVWILKSGFWELTRLTQKIIILKLKYRFIYICNTQNWIWCNYPVGLHVEKVNAYKRANNNNILMMQQVWGRGK